MSSDVIIFLVLSLFYILCFTENRLTENRVWPRMCTTICEKFLLHINFFLQKWFSYSLIELIRNTPIQMFWTKPWVILALRSYLVQIETSQFYVPEYRFKTYTCTKYLQPLSREGVLPCYACRQETSVSFKRPSNMITF